MQSWSKMSAGVAVPRVCGAVRVRMRARTLRSGEVYRERCAANEEIFPRDDERGALAMGSIARWVMIVGLQNRNSYVNDEELREFDEEMGTDFFVRYCPEELRTVDTLMGFRAGDYVPRRAQKPSPECRVIRFKLHFRSYRWICHLDPYLCYT